MLQDPEARRRFVDQNEREGDRLSHQVTSDTRSWFGPFSFLKGPPVRQGKKVRSLHSDVVCQLAIQSLCQVWGASKLGSLFLGALKVAKKTASWTPWTPPRLEFGSWLLVAPRAVRYAVRIFLDWAFDGLIFSADSRNRGGDAPRLCTLVS